MSKLNEGWEDLSPLRVVLSLKRHLHSQYHIVRNERYVPPAHRVLDLASN